MVFPKIAPAVIVGVTNGDKILMTKYAGREYKKYALIAGFTEIGETAEQTVEREVMEEVGLHVKNIRYYKSQPWGYDSDLLLGYFCELAEEHKIELDETELSLAEWIDYKDVPDDPQVIALITIDEPVGIYYGGTIAAPVVADIFSNILPYLNIVPVPEAD